MFVVVAASAAGDALAELCDPENLRQLHVEFREVDDAAAAEALAAAGLGLVADGHAWLEIDALRRAGDGSPAWSGQFEAMLDYARRMEWVDAQGKRLRAHIVRS